MTTPLEAGQRAQRFKRLQSGLDADAVVLAATLRRLSTNTPANRDQARAAATRLDRTAHELAEAATTLAAGIQDDLHDMEGPTT
ncbi:hypothetical protein [Kocuria sp.]|uniref:hypothetical protein n=1 Tax=Kocuria sp. TaxID=1871328 RepID=UPI0026DB44FA|nr:hypothetical protein [Kocuria sp.]MDO4920061.1 hypothetical protein [Kocuria sp.]